MASSELKFKRVVLDKEQPLGVGSYGSVFQAYCDDLVCAAKILHPTLVQINTSIRMDKLHRLPMKRFEAECAFLKDLHHPNIIQYLGMYEDNETGLPVLLMELMDESLTHFLESEPTQSISHATQLRLCQDIVTALSYLHSNNIVHRDLSSNNILLIGRYRAKVSDFGMATLLSNRSSQVSNTLCPGTDVYMPPEAIEKTANFTAKGDIFSFGVNVIQILTHKFPAPGDRFKTLQIDHPEIPQGSLEVRVSEVERRKAHIDNIDSSHPLLATALECIQDQATDRPSATELCQTFRRLKTGNPNTPTKEERTKPSPQEAEHNNVANPTAIKTDQEQKKIMHIRAQLEELQLAREQRQQENKLAYHEQQETTSQLPETRNRTEETNGKETKRMKLPALPPQTSKPSPPPHAKKPPTPTKPILPLRVEQTKPEPPPRLRKPCSPVYVNKPPLNEHATEQLGNNDSPNTNKGKQLHTYQQFNTQDYLEPEGIYDDLQTQDESDYINQLPGTNEAEELCTNEVTTQHSMKQARIKSAPLARITKPPPLHIHGSKPPTSKPPSPSYVNTPHSSLKLDSSLTISKPEDTYDDILSSFSQASTPVTPIKSAPPLLYNKPTLPLQDNKPAPPVPAHKTKQPPKTKLAARKSAPESLLLSIQNPQLATNRKGEFLPDSNGALIRSSKVIKKVSTPPLKKGKTLPKPKIQLPLPINPIIITWQRERNAPTVMSRDTDAVVSGSIVYLRPRRTRKIYSYVSTTYQWSKHIDCLTDNTTLAIVENSLTTIGGMHSKKLYTLSQNGDKKVWIENYPSMNTERARCTAVSSNSTLIVVGGLAMSSSGSQDIRSVEVLNTDEKQWTTAIDIPQPLHACSGQIVDDTLYLLGGLNTFSATKTVYSCSLVDLLTSCRSSHFRAKFAAKLSSTLWSTIADMPLTEATCIEYNNYLLAIGGRNEDNIPTDSVFAFDKQKNIWHKIDSLNHPRTLCFAATLQNDTILVVGGIAPPTQFGDVSNEIVELGTINKQ